MLRLLLQEHLPHTWATGAGGRFTLQLYQESCKKSQLFTTTSARYFQDSIWIFCKIKTSCSIQFGRYVRILSADHRMATVRCEGSHISQWGWWVWLIFSVLAFVSPHSPPFVSPDLYCSCSQNINLSLIYFPLMSQRKYWGLPPRWIVGKIRSWKISHNPTLPCFIQIR